MADIFIEHMITRRPDMKSRLIKAGLAFAVAVVSIVVLVICLINTSLMTIGFPVIAGACWGGYKLMRRRNVEFEYILTNGELDVDKIFDRSARKRLLSVNCQNFEILAPYKPVYTGDYESGIQVTIDASSGSVDAARHFAVFQNKDNKRTMLIFEPSERIMTAFRTYIPRKIK